jgi:hypothetical protein
METTISLIAHLIILFKQLHLVLEARNLWTLAAMTALLMKGKRARLYELARALPCDGELESRVQKLRRWLSHPNIVARDFLPVFLDLLAPVLQSLKSITLIIDRTSWTRLGIHLNLFLCSIAFNGRSFPVFWIFLPTRGCSGLTEQQELLTPVLAALAAHPLLSMLPVTVAADREFCSPLLADWLRTQWGVHFDIRVKKSYYVSREDFPSILISRFLENCQRGEYYFYPHVLLTEEHHIRVNLLIGWRPDCEEPIALISDLGETPAVTATYHQRPWIETLNRDLKSGGFDIERGKVTDSRRLSNLLIPVAFAYIFLVILGYAEELPSPPPQMKKGRHDVFPPHSPSPKRTHSLFTKARNRITDLLERKPLNIVIPFFTQFFDLLTTLLHQRTGDTTHTLFQIYARCQDLLLKGS